MPKEKWFHVEEEGELNRFGYAVNKSSLERHRALDKAVISTRNSGLEVWHKLDGISKVTIRTQPQNSRIYRADANYIKRRFYNTKYW